LAPVTTPPMSSASMRTCWPAAGCAMAGLKDAAQASAAKLALIMPRQAALLVVIFLPSSR